MPVIPILAAVGGGSALAGGLAVASTAAGAYSAIKGADQARKAANQANDAAKAAANGTGGGAVNIAALDQQARDLAAKNAADSAALEAQYNPGASELRSGSLQALLSSLGPDASNQLAQYAAGGPPSSPVSAGNAELLARIKAQAGQPLTNPGFDSQLTRDAVASARADLALGGQLPQDVRNLVARQAVSRSGTVSGGLTLGRDLTARDLGLTSLDLYNRRLQNASQLGSQEAGLEQANAAMRLNAEQFGRTNLLQSQGALDSVDARSAALASSNYFNQGSLLQQILNGGFSRALSAAQLGQNIAQPQSGLDPGSVVNLAVGNSNLAANAQQQAAARQVGAANQQSAFGGQLLGAGLGFAQNYFNNKTPTSPTISYDTYKAQNPYSSAVIGQ